MATPTLQVQPSTPARTSTVQRAQQPAAVVQRVAWVSSPADPAEKEAEHTAKKVMRMADPQVGRVAPAGIAQFVQRAGGGDNSAGPAAISTQIDAAAGGGRALPHGVKGFMESRFQANFSKVRVHTDQRAAKLNTQLGARAFTTGNHVFFGAGQFQPESADGRELIAHELTHTIQQGAARQVRRAKAPVDEKREPLVQRLGVSDVLDFFADAAYNIPGYRMFTIVIGVNPINMSAVDRSAANILRAVVEFIPGGGLIVQALDNYGVFDRAGAFIEQQLRTLGITGSAIRSALMRFVDSLSWTDIFDLGGVWDRAVAIFSNPVNRIISFVGSLGAAVLQMIKDAILRPLAGLASRTRAWDLLCAVLGENPITGDPVPRTAETLIGGFMKLIGKEEIWQNIQRANAIPRAWAWFQGAIQGLVGLVRQIPPTFMAALAALRIDDIVQLPTAFQRVASIFANFIGDFLRWAGNTVWSLLEIIFEVVAPGAMPYLRRAAGAFRSILENPIGFIGNLVRAGIRGFEQFSTNFLTHLRASLIGWLTGAMSGAGLYIPRSFSLVEILKFVLSVLGLTWQNIRTKLVRAVGETAVVAMERGFELIRTLVTEGPAAAWQQILEGLQNLQQIVIEGVMNFVKQRIVVAAVTRLVGMLNPAGAFIQAIIAIYNTVMFFVERLRQIIQVATAFMDSIMAIASGNIASAANRVEQTMAGLLTLVISFLARLAGLGRVADAVRDIINRVRAPIDRALDRVVTWIVEQARRLGRFAGRAASGVLNWWRERKQIQLGDGQTHTLSFRGNQRNARLMLASEEKPVQEHLAEAIADNTLSASAKTKAQRALAFYNSEIAPVSGVTIPEPVPANLQEKLNNLPNKLNEFATLLINIADPSVAMPAATFSWGGPAAATAEMLSNRSSRGGQDSRSGNPAGWALIVRRGLTSRNGNWVRMHMISAAYGGLDVDGNLIPAPGGINTGGAVRGFERQIESTFYGDASAADVRGASRLFKRLTSRQVVLWLRTSSGGFHPASSELDPTTRAPIYDARTFVTSVSFQCGLYYPNGERWVKDPTTRVTASVNIPRPDFSGTYVPAINTLGERTLAELAGISLAYAREIVSRKPFSGVADFRSKLRAGRTADGVEFTTDFQQAMTAVIGAVNSGIIRWRDP